MSTSQQEFDYYVDKIHNGATFVHLKPINVAVREHFKVGGMIISYELGMNLSRFYYRSPAVREYVTLLNKQKVEAWCTTFTPLHLVKSS